MDVVLFGLLSQERGRRTMWSSPPPPHTHTHPHTSLPVNNPSYLGNKFLLSICWCCVKKIKKFKGPQDECGLSWALARGEGQCGAPHPPPPTHTLTSLPVNVPCCLTLVTSSSLVYLLVLCEEDQEV